LVNSFFEFSTLLSSLSKAFLLYWFVSSSKSSLSYFSLSIPCFLSFEKETNPEYNAVVRLWKIRESQLEDLQKQEGKEWYGKIITLGEKDGLKILTLSALSIWMFLKKD